MNTGRAKKMRRLCATEGLRWNEEYTKMKKAKGVAWLKANIPKAMPALHKKKLEAQSLDQFQAKRKKINRRKRINRMGIGHKKVGLIRDGLLPRGTIKTHLLRKEAIRDIGPKIGFGYKL